MNNMLELFKTEVGSRMWKMEHSHSDFDKDIVYVMDSREFLLGKRIKGKQIQDKENKIDYTYYEIGMFVDGLIKGNVNYLWTVMSPICITNYKTSFTELRDIVSTNLSKNYYHSISGLSSHNMYHFITGEDKEMKIIEKLEDKYYLEIKEGMTEKRYQELLQKEMKKAKKKPTHEIDRNSLLFKKKLNVIGRTLKFGINLLLWHKTMFEKVDIKDEKELYDLKNELDKCYTNSTLPDMPNREPFEKYLVKWRLHKLKIDKLI